jgi:hypothetical protein
MCTECVLTAELVRQASKQNRGIEMTAWVYLTIKDPLVAWLVYRGQLFSADQVGPEALSIWHTNRLRAAIADPQSNAAAHYRGELAVESVRASRFATRTSRLQGFYVFPDHDTALRASATWDGRGFSPDMLAEVEIADTSRVGQYDAQWITYYLSSGDGAWIDQYLSGEPQSETPIWEWIVEGRAYIYDTDLRERARETALEKWPTSRSLLELARLGAWLGSDLGLIVALATVTPGGHHIEYWMNYADATDDAFITRVGEFGRDHPDQVDSEALADLEHNDPVRPDLTPRGFVVPITPA